jgi:hypothetical protein
VATGDTRPVLTVISGSGMALAGRVAAVTGPRAMLLGIGALTIVETAILLSVPSVRNLTDQPAAPEATGAPAPGPDRSAAG